MEQTCALNANFLSIETKSVHNHIAFSQLSKFLNCLSLKQKTNCHSYRASYLKAILLEYWFGYGTGISLEALVNSPADESSYIRRFLRRYIDEGRSYERGGILYPTQELIKNIVEVCHLSGVPIRFNVSKCELRVAPGLARGARELTGRCSLEDRNLSGQLIRLELALWEHMTSRTGELMSTSDIARRANISKSTLTTLLNAAFTHKMLTHHVDDNDERVTRWALNPSHPRNTQMYKALVLKFPEMRLASARELESLKLCCSISSYRPDTKEAHFKKKGILLLT